MINQSFSLNYVYIYYNDIPTDNTFASNYFKQVL
jgi:hypothetical protein